MSDLNPFTIAQAQFDEAAERLGLDDAMRQFLRWPMREFKVTLPVRMDDGKFKVFHGYRVQYNCARGPTKGGLRWHPDETIDTVRALAAWMTWKTSVVDIPLGGGKGGVTCNPKELSAGEQERLARVLHARRRPHPRRHEGRARARRVHEPADHGLDDGRVRDHRRGVPPRRDHGQAPLARRLAGPRRRDRARRRLLRPRGRQDHEHRLGQGDVRGPGLRQRRPVRRHAPPASSWAARSSWRRATAAAASTAPTAWIPTRS